MVSSRVLIGPDKVTPFNAGLDDAPNLTRESDQLIHGLTGFGFVASVVLAGLGTSAATAYAIDVGDSDALLGSAAVFLALSLASVHAWMSRTHAAASRDVRMAVVRHRVVLLLLGLACAWAGWVWMNVPASSAAMLVTTFLVMQAGFGSAAAATDRLSLAIWLGCIVAVPAVWVIASGGAQSRYFGPVLLTTGLITLGLAIRIRQMIRRSLRVRRENDRLVAQLRKQVALVEAADAEKSRFLGAASHDLRQPMHALGLFAAALERELRGTRHYPNVVSMARAVDALEQSFSAMLDVSRLDAGIVQPNLQSFPIRDVYRRLHMHCAGQAEESGLSLRFKAGGKLVTSDPQLLERILSNLVHNAIRYTKQGGVVVVTRTRERCTSIEVWDTGIGIAQDELPKVFNEFYQVENRGRDRTRGLGMGLSIVKRLVTLLGHQLEVKSTPGRGTVFRLMLHQTDLAEMPSMVLGADTIPAALDENRTVLVIDDEDAVRSGMQELLEGWGITVLLAGTVEQACQAVRDHASVIDIVVSDLRLGGGEDGIHAIAQVRLRYGAPLPAILITGDTSAAEVKRAHDSGHPVLFKPVRTRDLFAALRRVS